MSALQHQLEQLLSSGPVDIFDFLSSNPDSSHEEQLAIVLLHQKRSWQSSNPKLVEGFRLALSPSSESSGQVAKPVGVGTE